MSSRVKPSANAAPKTANRAKRTAPTIPPTPSESDVQKELRECRAEILCLRAKFNPTEIAKHKIQTVTTEQIFQDALYNAERDLQLYVEGSSDNPMVKELKDKLYKRDKEITALKKASKLEAEEITVLKRRCESLEIDYTKIKGMYESVANKLPSKDDMRILENDYRLKEEGLKKELHETREKLKIYTQKLPNILSKRHDAETLQKELDEVKSDRDSLRRNYAAVKKQLDSKEKELSEYMIEREALKEALNKGRSDLEELKSTNHSLSDTITKLKTDLSSAQSNDNKDLSATKTQISQLQHKLDSTEDEAEQLRKTIRELGLELKQVKDDSKGTLNSKTQMESDMKKLREENENLSKEIAHQSEVLHERDVELDKLQVKLSEAGSGVYRSVDGRISDSDRDNELSRLQAECESLTVLVASMSMAQNNKKSSQEGTRQLKQELKEMERIHARKSKESEQKLKEEKEAHARTKQAKDKLEMKCHDAFEKISQKEKKLLQQEANHKLLIERKDSTIKDLRREKTIVDPNANSKGDSKTLEASNKKMFDELEDMREENNELKMRLSKASSSQVLDGNADLVDLSDPFRPELLVEKFSELYDNEWTDALECCEVECGSTTESVEKLLKALFDVYQFCQDQSQVLTKRVLASFRFLPNNNTKIELSTLPPRRLNILRELVKIFATDLGQNVAEEYTKSYKPILASKDVSDRYIHQCVTVCWLMSVQNPPLVLDTGRPSGTFDDAVYRHFTKSGEIVDFIVWPPVRIQQTGRLICKGIAQGK